MCTSRKHLQGTARAKVKLLQLQLPCCLQGLGFEGLGFRVSQVLEDQPVPRLRSFSEGGADAVHCIKRVRILTKFS